jgi:hypothetical protein
MNTPFYFISYSRSQLYFAEAIAVHLQRMKVNVWFDLQQLKTGEDWASEIKQGLDDCSGVILIVSQRSISSKYVELEWKAALDAGKPIYLIYFEPSELPDERLQSCPAIDGRGRFQSAMRQLSRAIKEGETPHEGPRFWNISSPKRLARFLAADDDGIMRFPTKLAPGMLMITLSVVAISVTLILATLIVATVFGIPFSLWLGALAGYGFLVSSHYVRRKLVGPPPRLFVLVALGGMMGLLFMTQSFPTQQNTLVVFTGIIAAFTTLFVLALVFCGGDVLRWTLTGFANERVRRRYHGGRWMHREGKGNHRITYRILHSRGDEKFAKQLVRAMNKYRHVLTSTTDDQPDQFTFFLLSNVTVWDEVRTALKVHPRLIAAAMTTVGLPRDVKDQLGRFQYLDARTDAKQRFNTMAATLTETQVQSNTLSASIETTPANLDMTVIPRRVQAGLGALRAYTIIGFSAPVLVVIQLILARSTNTNAQFTPLEIIISVLAALVFAVFCVCLDYLARFRQITTPMFMLLYAAGMIILSIVTPIVGGIQVFGLSYGDDPSSVIPGIVIFFLTSAGLFAWLPTVAPRTLSLIDLREQVGSVVRAVIVISIISVYAAFVILTPGVFAVLGTSQMFSAYAGAPIPDAFSMIFPPDTHLVPLQDGQLDPRASYEDFSTRDALQTFVDEVLERLGDDFVSDVAAYRSDGQGYGLRLVIGRFRYSAENDSPNYAQQRLHDLAQKIGAVYQPGHIFGSGSSVVPGALVELKLSDEAGSPRLVNILAIDTARTHHLIYITSSDTPAMRAWLKQFLFQLGAVHAGQ